MGIIKGTFTPTSVGSDGSGYYQGPDGKFGYGNLLLRGYVVSTERDAPQVKPQSDSTDYWDLLPSGPSEEDSLGMAVVDGVVLFGSIIAAALSMAALATIAVYLMILAPFAIAFAAVAYTWPYYLSFVIKYLKLGIVDLPVILILATVAFLIIYFIICASQVLTKKVMRTKRMCIVCVVAMTVLHSFFDLVGGHFGIGAFLSAFFNALLLSILPVVGIVFCEHLVTKDLRNDQRWFLTRLAQCITPFMPKQGKGLAVFGAITCVVSVLSAKSASLGFLIGWKFLPLGALLTVMGLLDVADKAKAKEKFKV